MTLTLRTARFGLMLALVACADEPPPPAPPPEPPLEIVLPDGDFDGYIGNVRQQIARAASDTGEQFDPDVLSGRAPFQLRPSDSCPRGETTPHRRGALLIHDIGDSPYLLRGVAEGLTEACLFVRAILLPGHGTSSDDLLRVDLEDWDRAVRRGVSSMRDQVEELTLVGAGLGGSLALRYHLMEPGVPLEALVLIAPAIAPSGPNLDLSGLFEIVTPREAEAGAPLPIDDPFRYRTLPPGLKPELERLVDGATPDGLIDVPVFMVLSAEDPEVDAAAARRLFCRQLTGPRQLVLYSREGAPVTDCRFVVSRRSASAAVLDYDHTGLTVAPDDLAYGRNGRSIDCTHYLRTADQSAWLVCRDPSKRPEGSAIRYGTIRPENLERWLVRRLTWNPDFDGMMIEIRAFLGALR